MALRPTYEESRTEVEAVKVFGFLEQATDLEAADASLGKPAAVLPPAG